MVWVVAESDGLVGETGAPGRLVYAGRSTGGIEAELITLLSWAVWPAYDVGCRAVEHFKMGSVFELA